LLKSKNIVVTFAVSMCHLANFLYLSVLSCTLPAVFCFIKYYVAMQSYFFLFTLFFCHINSCLCCAWCSYL